jgi:hypothetical protein
MNLNMYSFLKKGQFKILVGLICVMTLSGCLDSNAAEGYFADAYQAKTYKNDISDNTLKVVNSAFYNLILGGDWRYKGASNKNGSINAYIQIPQELDMSIAAQKNYLKQAICPSAQYKKMWEEIQGTALSVHLYTHTQKRSVFANCDNPLA